MVNQVDPEINARQDAAFLAKVAEARRMSIGEKLAAGPLLIDVRCRNMRCEIRTQFPSYTDAQVEEALRRQLALEKKLSDGDIYRDAGFIPESESI